MRDLTEEQTFVGGFADNLIIYKVTYSCDKSHPKIRQFTSDNKLD